MILRLLIDRTVSQAELAGKLEVEPRTVTRVLRELSTAGVPLEREEDPPNVYWSVPKGWVPGGVTFGGDLAVQLLEQLSFAPRNGPRDRLMAHIVTAVSGAPRFLDVSEGPALSEKNVELLTRIQHSAAERCSIGMRYFSASRRALSNRVVSVQRVEVGDTPRFVVFCHTRGEPRWFRLDGVESLFDSANEPYIEMDETAINRFLGNSHSGFNDGGTPVPCEFFVRDPDWSWVQRNLPGPFAIEQVEKGSVCKGETAALQAVARFVAGLGEIARPLSPALRTEVRKLAHGALKSLAVCRAGEDDG